MHLSISMFIAPKWERIITWTNLTPRPFFIGAFSPTPQAQPSQKQPRNLPFLAYFITHPPDPSLQPECFQSDK